MKTFNGILAVLLLIVVATACSSSQPIEETRQLTILYTNDEHGWMAGVGEGKGAANLAGLWDAEDYGENNAVLVLSGGDNWTGPAISTWFFGQGMVEVMNAMAYDASVIGNHEFDFGLDILETRLGEASFPYLSANMHYKKNGEVPRDLGIEPYTIIDLNGMKVGIIGLTTTATPGVTNPKNVAEFDFIEYRQALEEYVPKVRDAGADIVILASHVCTDELTRLAWQVKSLNIAVMGGGHCHELYSSQVGETVIIEGGSYLASYAYVQLTYDPATKEITNKEFGTRMNSGGKADEEIAQIVQSWQKRTDAELNVTIGYLVNEIPRSSQKMEDLITKSWLNGYPAADIAITNRGGIRDNLPAGDITLANIISVMPFDNTLIALSLTGKQVIQVVERGKSPAVGGTYKSGDQWIIDKTGEPLGEDKTYVVLVNDFMYAGGDNYDMLAQFDPDAYDTSIGWRDPVIDWIREQGSTPEKPLDLVIEGLSG